MMRMALGSVVESLDSLTRAVLLNQLVKRLRSEGADEVIELLIDWFGHRGSTLRTLKYKSVPPSPQTDRRRLARMRTVDRLCARLHDSMVGQPPRYELRWPTISHEQAVKLARGELTIELAHAPPRPIAFNGRASGTVATLTPSVVIPPGECHDLPDEVRMPRVSQVERLEGVFAFFEMERQRKIAAEERPVPIITVSVRDRWRKEFGIIGGDKVMQKCVTKWKDDLARHRSNALVATPALAALRASEHAAKLTPGQFESIVGPVAESARATHALWLYLLDAGLIVHTRGGKGLRYRVTRIPGSV